MIYNAHNVKHCQSNVNQFVETRAAGDADPRIHWNPARTETRCGSPIGMEADVGRPVGGCKRNVEMESHFSIMLLLL